MSDPTFKNLSALVESPESRRVEWTKDALVETRIYVAAYDVARAALKAPFTAGTDDLEGFIIRSSVVEAVRPGLGRLVDVWVFGGDDADPETVPLPQDEVAVSATNQSPRLERHPRYVSLTSEQLALVENALRAQTNARNDAYEDLNTLGKELVDKIRAGNESYYLATLRYSWAVHSYTVPNTTRGGFVESISGPLAGYFSGSISWLREADQLEYSNGIWRKTVSWLGADTWDEDIYD